MVGSVVSYNGIAIAYLIRKLTAPWGDGAGQPARSRCKDRETGGYGNLAVDCSAYRAVTIEDQKRRSWFNSAIDERHSQGDSMKHRATINTHVCAVWLLAFALFAKSATGGEFTPTGDMNTARVDHAAVKLDDGKVLIIGGLVGKQRKTDTCEVYDFPSGRFKPTGKTIDTLLNFEPILQTDGRVVLVAASRKLENGVVVSAATEIYDPIKGEYTVGPKMVTPRWFGVSAHLSDGRFLFIGGEDDNHKPLYNAEIYDPERKKFVDGGQLAEKLLRLDFAVPLPNGNVLIRGRDTNAGMPFKYESYEPSTRTFHSVTGPALDEMSQAYWAALPSGKVIFYSPKGNLSLFDPSSGVVKPLGKSEFGGETGEPKVVPLSNEKILLSATLYSMGKTETEAAVFDLSTRVWTPAVKSESVHSGGSVTLLNDGKVLFAGGSDIGKGAAGLVFNPKADIFSP